MYKTFKIKTDTRINDSVRYFLYKNHYLKTLPRGCKKVVGLFLPNSSGKITLSGVAVYGYPTGRGVNTKYGSNTLELKRFALTTDCQKNTGSWFMSKCHKLLKKQKLCSSVVSYADPSQGHEGNLYRACNFKYEGLQKFPTQYIKYKGLIINAGNVSRYRKHVVLAKLYKEGKLQSYCAPKKHIFSYAL